MATLLRLNDSSAIPLPSPALAGRARTCWLKLDERFASGQHASFSFDGLEWIVRDLGSRNGTYVGGRPIVGSCVLTVGARIGFGSEEPSYEVVDLEPPRAVAQDLETGEIITGRHDLLMLPNAEQPEAMVYASGSGWILEPRSEAESMVQVREVVRVGGRSYRLFLPLSFNATPIAEVAFNIHNATFRFAVGAKGECIGIDLVFRGITFDRFESGEFGMLMLALARARLEDRSRPIDERGWRSVEELCDLLNVDPAALNVAIYRARRRVALTKLGGGRDIIEVRRGMRRFGTDGIGIVEVRGAPLRQRASGARARAPRV